MWTKFSLLRTEHQCGKVSCGVLAFIAMIHFSWSYIFCKSQPSTSSEQAGMMDEHDTREEMTLDEQMIVRCACGYVGMKIHKILEATWREGSKVCGVHRSDAC